MEDPNNPYYILPRVTYDVVASSYFTIGVVYSRYTSSPTIGNCEGSSWLTDKSAGAQSGNDACRYVGGYLEPNTTYYCVPYILIAGIYFYGASSYWTTSWLTMSVTFELLSLTQSSASMKVTAYGNGFQYNYIRFTLYDQMLGFNLVDDQSLVEGDNYLSYGNDVINANRTYIVEGYHSFLGGALPGGFWTYFTSPPDS